MTKKHDNRGRSHGDGHFFQMFDWFMRTAAWRHASVYERSLYLELKRRYNGKNNGDIPLSHREAMALLNCSNTAVAKAFDGLVNKGFVKAERKGAFDWKVSASGRNHGRSTRWLLTELPQDLPIRSLTGGSKDFMRWQPAEKSAVRSERTQCPSTADHSETLVRSERTMTRRVSAHVGR